MSSAQLGMLHEPPTVSSEAESSVLSKSRSWKQGLESAMNEWEDKTQNLVIDYLAQKKKKMITGGNGRCALPGILGKAWLTLDRWCDGF